MQAREVLAKAPGLDLLDEPQRNIYPMPLQRREKTTARSAGCGIDCALENGLAFWVSGDQLLKAPR